MKSIVYTTFIALLFLTACKETAPKEGGKSLEVELQEKLKIAETTMEELRTDFSNLQSEISSPLIHVVFLDLKPDIDQDAVLSEINKLKGITVVRNLQIGKFKDLSDKRALSGYELIFQMGFANESHYKMYQEHETHLALKKALGEYLSKPPVTFDYEVKK